MKNLAKILILAILVASVMMFAACGNDGAEDLLEGRESIRAVVITAPGGARGEVLLSPLGNTDFEGKFIVNIAGNIYFATEDDDLESASGTDLIGWEDGISGTEVSVYFTELPEDVEDDEYPVLEDAIIVLDAVEVEDDADGDSDED